jgi:hypothetical protein
MLFLFRLAKIRTFFLPASVFRKKSKKNRITSFPFAASLSALSGNHPDFQTVQTKNP